MMSCSRGPQGEQLKTPALVVTPSVWKDRNNSIKFTTQLPHTNTKLKQSHVERNHLHQQLLLFESPLSTPHYLSTAVHLYL